jgi:hypothetical protein
MSSALYYGCCFAFVLPYLTIAAALLHNSLRRARWKRGKKRRTLNPAFCPSSAALGTVLLFAHIFYRPSVAQIVESQRQIDVEEDDSGDPETPEKLLHRQLRRIRRGELVGRLSVRL